MIKRRALRLKEDFILCMHRKDDYVILLSRKHSIQTEAAQWQTTWILIAQIFTWNENDINILCCSLIKSTWPHDQKEKASFVVVHSNISDTYHNPFRQNHQYSPYVYHISNLMIYKWYRNIRIHFLCTYNICWYYVNLYVWNIRKG